MTCMIIYYTQHECEYGSVAKCTLVSQYNDGLGCTYVKMILLACMWPSDRPADSDDRFPGWMDAFDLSCLQWAVRDGATTDRIRGEH